MYQKEFETVLISHIYSVPTVCRLLKNIGRAKVGLQLSGQKIVYPNIVIY